MSREARGGRQVPPAAAQWCLPEAGLREGAAAIGGPPLGAETTVPPAGNLAPAEAERERDP